MQLREILNIEDSKQRNNQLDDFFTKPLDIQLIKEVVKEINSEPKLTQIKLLDFVQSKESKSFQVNHFTIQKYLDLNALDEAEKLIEKLDSIPPFHDRLHFLQGVLHEKRSDTALAIKHYKFALEHAKNENQKFRPYHHLLQIYLDLKKYKEAKIHLDQLAAYMPEHLQVHIKNIKFLKATKPEGLSTQLKKSLELHPKNTFLRTEFLQILIKKSEFEKAKAFLNETQKLGIEHYSFPLSQGTIHQENGNYQEALAFYKKTTVKYPDKPIGYMKYISLAFILGDIEVAFNMIETLKKRFPNEINVVKKEVELLFKIGKFQEGRKVLVQAKKKFSNDSKSFLQLELNLALAQGQLEKAQEISKLFPSSNVRELQHKLMNFGNLSFIQYDFEKTVYFYTKAFECNHHHPGLWRRLAAAHMSLGDIDSCRKILKEATISLQNNKSSIIPLKSHTALISNDIRLNPKALKKITEASIKNKWKAFSEILTTEPNYFGAAFYFCIYLRKNGIFEQLENSVTKTPDASIPKNIIQYWDQPNIPRQMEYATKTWTKKNKEYNYFLFNKKTALEFIEEHYSETEVKAFWKCNHPAMESDYFRLAFLNIKGGIYTDIDDACSAPLDSLIDKNYQFIMSQEDMGTIGNNFMAFVPNHDIIKNALQQATKNLSEYFNEGPWFKTGPGLITQAFAQAIIKENKDLKNTNLKFKVLSQQELRTYVYQHLPLPYKTSNKSWFNQAYRTKLK